MNYTSQPKVDHEATLKPVGYAFVKDVRFAANGFWVGRLQGPELDGREPVTALYTQSQLDAGYANLGQQRDRLKARIRELEEK